MLASAVPARADATRDRQWYLKALKVAEAQRITKGAGVIVAVLDTGVEAGHPDLKGAVLPGINTVREGAKGNADTEGHGTGMAGIIAARGRSGERGLIGIAPAAKILPIRPADDPIFAADGLRYAAANGAKVINMSFGVRQLGSAAGGGPGRLSTPTSCWSRRPATPATPTTTSTSRADIRRSSRVGATDRNGKIAKFSQHGPQVDIVAPGTGMVTAGLGDTYREGFGTSNAAAVVSGAAALIRAKYPELTAAQVVERLTSTAVDRGDPGRDDYYGHGELDLIAALTAPPPARRPRRRPPMPRLRRRPRATATTRAGSRRWCSSGSAWCCWSSRCWPSWSLFGARGGGNVQLMVDQPMVVVRGEAFREVPPELAVFSVTVSARDKDRQTTLTRLTERAAELRTALDDYPDAIERRETGGVQIYPELKRGGERVSAYTGSVTTTVTVTDFAVLGRAAAATRQPGADLGVRPVVAAQAGQPGRRGRPQGSHRRRAQPGPGIRRSGRRPGGPSRGDPRRGHRRRAARR